MPDVKIVKPQLQQYVDYINNTAQVPLAVADFDEDWEPIGPMLRNKMLYDGLIYMGGEDLPIPQPEGIYLRPDLVTT